VCDEGEGLSPCCSICFPPLRFHNIHSYGMIREVINIEHFCHLLNTVGLMNVSLMNS